MSTIREQLEQREAAMLAPQAARSARSRGRLRSEPEDPVRPAFQRDRDRIIHCKAFRRLIHKTQVFFAPAGDHYRTRLTHTLEVAQIARTIAKGLWLHEDLTEAIALGHDLAQLEPRVVVPVHYKLPGFKATLGIDGTDVRDFSLASLRRHIGIVHQDTFLFSATIRDNISYGRPDATAEQIVAAAKTVRWVIRRVLSGRRRRPVTRKASPLLMCVTSGCVCGSMGASWRIFWSRSVPL